LAGPALLRTMADNWWLVLLRGIAAIAFGILAFVSERPLRFPVKYRQLRFRRGAS
jgi:hypothetical protein